MSSSLGMKAYRHWVLLVSLVVGVRCDLALPRDHASNAVWLTPSVKISRAHGIGNTTALAPKIKNLRLKLEAKPALETGVGILVVALVGRKVH